MFEEIREHNESEKQNIADKHIVKVKQYLSEKTDEELKEILKQQNNPEFLTYHTVQELKLRKNEREKRYKKYIETANEVLARRKIIQRLAPNEEKGRIAGGRRNVEASIILGRSRRTDRSSLSSQENAKSQQENVLKDYAKAVDIWKDYKQIISKAIKQVPAGAESTVFLYEENGNKFMIKVTDYSVMEKTPMSFIDNHISLANFLSPETKYELIGFTERSRRFCFVVKQPFIEGEEMEYFIQNAKDLIKEQIKVQDEIKDWMWDTYQAKFDRGTSYYNERYRFDDLHFRNILKDKNGNLYNIDLIVGLNTSDKGGKAKYLPFKITNKKTF